MDLFYFSVPQFDLYYWMCDGKIVVIHDLDGVYIDLIFLVRYCNFNNPDFMQFNGAIVKFKYDVFLNEYLEDIIDYYGTEFKDSEIGLFVENLKKSLI